MVTNAQVRRLRENRMSGKTLAAAAAAAGMSERTARTWQRGALPSTAKAPRTWRTREDPFADVWQSEVVLQLVADTDGRLQVLTLFKVLCRRHPGRFQAGQLRTLQRRVRDWRVQYGVAVKVDSPQIDSTSLAQREYLMDIRFLVGFLVVLVVACRSGCSSGPVSASSTRSGRVSRTAPHRSASWCSLT